MLSFEKVFHDEAGSSLRDFKTSHPPSNCTNNIASAEALDKLPSAYDMISALQPRRPEISPQASKPDPRHQLQTRTQHTTATQQAFRRPRSQIEALPPHMAPPSAQQPPALAAIRSQDPALLHPVFFANSWHRAPFPMPLAPSHSPIASGYAFGIDQRKGSQTKL